MGPRAPAPRGCFVLRVFVSLPAPTNVRAGTVVASAATRRRERCVLRDSAGFLVMRDVHFPWNAVRTDFTVKRSPSVG